MADEKRFDLKVERVVNTKEWKAISDLLEESFPVHELRSRAMRKRMAEDMRYFPCGAYKGGLLAGALCYWKTPVAYYIEHFAIRRDLRCRGYGAEILGGFIEKKRVILEAEPPVEEIQKRRIEFYKKMGFHRSGITFIHPSFQKDAQPYPLEVMSYPSAVDKREFYDFRRFFDEVVCMYSEKHDAHMNGVDIGKPEML